MSTINFSADMWLEILARLPVKTLLRFKSVCKSLCNIIEDPYFVSKHLKQYHNGGHGGTTTHLLSLHIATNRRPTIIGDIRAGGVRDKTRCKISLRRSDTLTETRRLVDTSDNRYSIEGSCLGLNLIIVYYPRREVRLWNPSIRKSILLPPCPFRTPLTPCVVAYALGFSPSTHQFKVAAFQYSRSEEWEWEQKQDYPRAVAVYTVGDNSNSVWRILPHDSWSASIPLDCQKFGVHRLFFQGALHWLICDKTITCMADTHLVSFDLDSEKFSWVELPDNWDKEHDVTKFLFLLGEELAFMSISEVERCVWIMKKDDCGGAVSWQLWFSCASSDEQISKFYDYRFSLNTEIYHVDDGGTSFSFRNCCYDIATSKMKRLVECGCYDEFRLETYMESMALNKQGQAFPSK